MSDSLDLHRFTEFTPDIFIIHQESGLFNRMHVGQRLLAQRHIQRHHETEAEGKKDDTDI